MIGIFIPGKTVFILNQGPVDIRIYTLNTGKYAHGLHFVFSVVSNSCPLTCSLSFSLMALPPGYRKRMMTSSNGNNFRVLAICTENSPVTGEFPAQRPVMRSLDVFFDLCLNKRLSKQSWGWWFETPWCSLWRHCNGIRSLWWCHMSFMASQITVYSSVYSAVC